MSNLPIFLFEFIVFIFSVIVHEISHGVVAEKLGDPTARLAGRLTFNPLKHIDMFGSILLPLALALPALFGAPAIIFGWAKPVPYDPRNLKNPKSGAGKIAAAGPVSNFALAIIFGILFRAIAMYGNPSLVPLAGLFVVIIYVNILLAVFNLVPIPPLDGSKILFAFLPNSEAAARMAYTLERYGMLLLLFFIFFGLDLIRPLMAWIFGLITGMPLTM